MFSCGHCETFRCTYFEEHLRTAASEEHLRMAASEEHLRTAASERRLKFLESYSYKATKYVSHS